MHAYASPYAPHSHPPPWRLSSQALRTALSIAVRSVLSTRRASSVCLASGDIRIAEPNERRNCSLSSSTLVTRLAFGSPVRLLGARRSCQLGQRIPRCDSRVVGCHLRQWIQWISTRTVLIIALSTFQTRHNSIKFALLLSSSIYALWQSSWLSGSHVLWRCVTVLSVQPNRQRIAGAIKFVCPISSEVLRLSKVSLKWRRKSLGNIWNFQFEQFELNRSKRIFCGSLNHSRRLWIRSCELPETVVPKSWTFFSKTSA